jgi:hypothetical protein
MVALVHQTMLLLQETRLFGARPEIPINAADGGLGAPDIVAAAGGC